MSDVLLDTAVANWGPRFTANGVDASDYARITGPLEHWDDWCAAWCAGAQEQLELGEVALAEDRRRSASEYFARAATYFHFGKFMFVHDMDQAKDAHTAPWTRSTARRPVRAAGKSTRDPFENSKLVGLFRRPHVDGPHPTVLLIPVSTRRRTSFEKWNVLPRPRHGDFRTRRPRAGRGGMDAAHSTGVGGRRRDRHWVSPIDARRGLESNRRLGSVPGGFYAARLASANLPVRATIALAGPYNLGATWKDLNPLTRHAFEVRSYSPSPEAAERRPGHDA